MTGTIVYKVAISTIIGIFIIMYEAYLYNTPEMDKSGKIAIIIQSVVMALAFVGMWV